MPRCIQSSVKLTFQTVLSSARHVGFIHIYVSFKIRLSATLAGLAILNILRIARPVYVADRRSLFCVYNQSNCYRVREISNYWSGFVFLLVYFSSFSSDFLQFSLVTILIIPLTERTETRVNTELDRNGPNYRIGPECAGRA